jgi:uncharacterized protein YfaP (DUF2135 family)
MGPTGPAGNPGTDGTDGAVGEPGDNGPTGPDGLKGKKGPTGPAGNPGAQGNPGPNGKDGKNGHDGPQGPQGACGSDGAQGTPGANGADGAAGPNGPAGPAGPEGPQGSQGLPGPSGPVGPAGLQGPTGPEGAVGATGPAGKNGESGPQGPSGNVGPQGPAGPNGLVGKAGPQGPMGPQGLQGPIGPQGPEGLAGLDAEPVAVQAYPIINSTGFYVSSVLMDATTAQPYLNLVNVVITFTNTLNPTIVLTGTYTPSTGLYLVTSLVAGDYNVRITSDQTILFEVVVTITGSVTSVNPLFMFTLSPSLTSNQWRFLLYWGNVNNLPKDLDTQLYTPTGEVVTFDHKYSLDSNVVLNVDSRVGTVPEVLTVNFNLPVGVAYHYVVYNYSQEVPFVQSQARVEIYHLTTHNTVNITTTGTGNYWWVLDLNNTGVVLKNTLLATVPWSVQSGVYNVSNSLVNACTGNSWIGLTGVVVSFLDSNNKTWLGCYNAVTGSWSISGIPAGLYTISISAPSIISYSFNYVVSGNSVNSNELRFVISQRLLVNQWRATLTWGSSPLDLDTQLTVVSHLGGSELVTYYHKTSSTLAGFQNKINLDVDCTSGLGPETVSIMNDSGHPADWYHYVVYDFNHSNLLAASGATVKLYNHQSTAVVQTWVVNPMNAVTNGWYWHVFKLNMNGYATVNVINSSPNPI